MTADLWKPAGGRPLLSGPFKIGGLLTIPFFLIIIAAFAILNNKTVFEPPLVLPVMNTLFLGIIPVFIAILACRTYRINGSVSVLLLGSGMLVFGLGSIAAGWLNGLPDGSNITPTIHNTAVFIGSALSLVAVLLVLSGTGSATRKAVQSVPVLVYGGVVAFIAVFSYAAVLGLIPPFFMPGTGPTELRQVVLSNGAEMYALASILFFVLYVKKRDNFFFWFSLSLGLVATGLIAVFIQPAVGSLIGWAGRTAQYLGACFALVAIMAARQSASRAGISLPDQFGTFFGSGAATQAILAAAKESIWLIGTDNIILMANTTALERLGGRSAGEVIGHRYQEFMSEELAQSRRARLEEVIRTKQPVRFEDERDGIIFDHSFYPVFDEAGAVTSIAVFSRDITARKRTEDALGSINEELSATNEELTATQEKLQQNLDELVRNEKKLRESEDRYRTVADFTLDWEFWFDPDGKFIYVSPSAERILGRTVSSFTSVDPFLREVVHSEDLPLLMAHLKDELAGKGPSELEFRIVRPDGEVRWIHHVCRPIRDPSGRFLGTRGSNRDITERKRVEQALRGAQERTAAILEGIADTFYSIDEEWRFTLVNPAAEKAPFGKPAAELIGRVIWDLYPNLVGTPIHRHYLDAAEKFSLEHYEALSPLNGRWYEVFMQGWKGGVDVYMRDITVRKQHEEDLREKNEELVALNEELRQANDDVLLNEARLRETHHHLATLVSSMQIGILLVLGDKIGLANQTFCDYFGLGETPEEMIGLDSLEMIEKIRNAYHDPDKEVNRISEIVRRGEPVIGEEIAIRGGRMFLRDYIPITFEGTISGRLWYHVDITDRKRAEEALKESEERFRVIAETSPVLLSVSSLADGTVLFTNPAYDSTFGFSRREPVGWKAENLFVNASERDEIIDTLKNEGVIRNREVLVKRKDGTPFWISASMTRVRFGGTEVILGASIDITDRRLAEEALLKARDELEIRVEERTAELKEAVEALETERHRLYDVLETLPVYVCLLDRDYRMPFANRYFRETFGYSGTRCCYDFLFNRDGPCEICETYTVMKTHAHHHWYWTGPNGRDYDIYDYPFIDSDGSLKILEMGIDITERKKAEEERAILAAIVENSEDAIIGKSLDGTILSWNNGAETIYGYSADEAIGRKISILIPPGHGDDLEEILGRIRKGEPILHYDTVRIRKDRVPIQVSLTISPIRDRNGTLIGASTIARDITEWKRVEEAVKSANAYNRSLIEVSLDPLVTISPDGSISDVNEATIRVTGFSREELVGTDFSDYFTEPEKAQAGYEKVFRDGSVTDYALEIRHRDGLVTPVLYNATVYRDEAGNITGVFAAARDITGQRKAEEALLSSYDLLEKRVRDRTAELAEANEQLRTGIEERIRAEEALRETSEYLEKLISSANAPIIVWDREFRITRFNHAAELLTGRTAGDMIGKRIEVLFPTKYVHSVMDLIRRTMTGEQLNIVEIPVLHRSGDVRVVLWNSASLYGPDGKSIESTIAQGQDITVRKRAEEELLRKNEELVALNEELTATQEELQRNVEELGKSEEALRQNEAELREALGEKEVLLAEIHHRVKNNLTAFISLLSLEGSYDESPTGLALKKDLQNRARSMALIHETLYRTGKYSSVEMGMYLSTLVEQIAGSYNPERPVGIHVSGDGISLDLARATPCGLIVNELVTNSFKYAFPATFDCETSRGAPCTIAVGIAREGDMYVMTIRDNGIGLPAGFDARNARSLGLKLVNFLARHQLRATVGVRSEQGTEFEIRFPINPQHKREP